MATPNLRSCKQRLTRNRAKSSSPEASGSKLRGNNSNPVAMNSKGCAADAESTATSKVLGRRTEQDVHSNGECSWNPRSPAYVPKTRLVTTPLCRQRLDPCMGAIKGKLIVQGFFCPLMCLGIAADCCVSTKLWHRDLVELTPQLIFEIEPKAILKLNKIEASSDEESKSLTEEEIGAHARGVGGAALVGAPSNGHNKLNMIGCGDEFGSGGKIGLVLGNPGRDGLNMVRKDAKGWRGVGVEGRGGWWVW
ncbi:hypothetical protein Acr_00g0052950 [Actinidia rufa]|uniref:Uncharacterized protein n=1 Tax=Actinidia rufa TaxID=165716 RepID=A0A7J0DN61_9ERIC|nr:hypothetical protein Acr_00g0052950 [Actinidia rufa]